MLVIFAHLFAFRYPQALAGAPVLQLVVAAGGLLGVKFFFVISGYIITKLLLDEKARTGSISIAGFYVRRGFRILPAMWMLLGFVALAHSAGWTRDGGSLGRAAAFLCNVSWCDWFVNHMWSLAVEEQFYLVWPWLVATALPLAFVSAAAMVTMLLLAQASLLFSASLNNGLSFACIAAGAFCAAAPNARPMIERIASAAALLLAAGFLLGRPLIPVVFSGQYRLQDLLTPALICFVIFGSYRHKETLRPITVVMAPVGLISYGLYLWQQPFLASFEQYPRSSWLELWPVFIVIAIASYVLVERPLQRLGSRLSQRLKAQGVGSVPREADPPR